MTALTPQQKMARNTLIEELALRQPGADHAGLIREASRIAASPQVAPSLAEIAQGSRKAARRVIERAAVTRALAEALTASTVPVPPAGPGRAAPASSPAAPQAEGKPLHEMSADELRAYSAQALQDNAEARGLSSPIWQDGGVLSTGRH